MSTVPSGLGGVPTQRKTMSVSLAACLTLSVKVMEPLAIDSFISSCRPGS